MIDSLKQLLPLYANLIGGVVFLMISVASMVRRSIFRQRLERKDNPPNMVKMQVQLLDLRVPFFYGLILGGVLVGLYLVGKPIPRWFGVLFLVMCSYNALRLLFPRTGANAGQFFE